MALLARAGHAPGDGDKCRATLRRAAEALSMGIRDRARAVPWWCACPAMGDDARGTALRRALRNASLVEDLASRICVPFERYRQSPQESPWAKRAIALELPGDEPYSLSASLRGLAAGAVLARHSTTYSHPTVLMASLQASGAFFEVDDAETLATLAHAATAHPAAFAELSAAGADFASTCFTREAVDGVVHAALAAFAAAMARGDKRCRNEAEALVQAVFDAAPEAVVTMRVAA